MIGHVKRLDSCQRNQSRYRKWKENIELYGMMLPVLIWIFVFCYLPIYGVLIAFQDYYPGAPFFALNESVKWVGLKHFKRLFGSIYFERMLVNTLRLSMLQLVFGFWAPILFALLVNEIRNPRYKKIVQTASYMPHFISSVVVAGMVLSFISPGGIINRLIAALGGPNIAWNVKPAAFPVIYTLTNVWKSFGFNAILYMSTISSIDPALYESARMDGAHRGQMAWYITLPMMKTTIAVMLIMAVGGILSTNTELILLLYNEAIYKTADVFGTYVYREGLQGGRFSFGAAVGLFTQLIGFVLVFAANQISGKLTGAGLW